MTPLSLPTGTNSVVEELSVSDLCSYSPDIYVNLRLDSGSYLKLDVDATNIVVRGPLGRTMVTISKMPHMSLNPGVQNMRLAMQPVITSPAALAYVIEKTSEKTAVDIEYALTAKVASQFWPALTVDVPYQTLQDVAGVNKPKPPPPGDSNGGGGSNGTNITSTLQAFAVRNNNASLTVDLTVKITGLAGLLKLNVTIPSFTLSLYNGTARTEENRLGHVTNSRFMLSEVSEGGSGRARGSQA